MRRALYSQFYVIINNDVDSILYYIITIVYLIILLSELYLIFCYFILSKCKGVDIFGHNCILQCNYTSYICESESFVLFIFLYLL